MGGLKDYNYIVDSIMNLTGSYKSKSNHKPNTPNMPQMMPFPNHTPLFASIPITPIGTPLIENPKPLFPDAMLLGIPQINFERTVSRSKNNPVDLDSFELPPELEGVSRQTSISNILGEEFGRKKFKMNNGGSGYTFPRENSLLRDLTALFGNSALKGNEIEDFFQTNPLPTLSKKSSAASQAMAEEQPSLFRFHSNMSSWYKE